MGYNGFLNPRASLVSDFLRGRRTQTSKGEKKGMRRKKGEK